MISTENELENSISLACFSTPITLCFLELKKDLCYRRGLRCLSVREAGHWAESGLNSRGILSCLLSLPPPQA